MVTWQWIVKHWFVSKHRTIFITFIGRQTNYCFFLNVMVCLSENSNVNRMGCQLVTWNCTYTFKFTTRDTYHISIVSWSYTLRRSHINNYLMFNTVRLALLYCWYVTLGSSRTFDYFNPWLTSSWTFDYFNPCLTSSWTFDYINP